MATFVDSSREHHDDNDGDTEDHHGSHPIAAGPTTRGSLEWFQKSRERWAQRPRRRIVPLTTPTAAAAPPPPPCNSDDEAQKNVTITREETNSTMLFKQQQQQPQQETTTTTTTTNSLTSTPPAPFMMTGASSNGNDNIIMDHHADSHAVAEAEEKEEPEDEVEEDDEEEEEDDDDPETSSDVDSSYDDHDDDDTTQSMSSDVDDISDSSRDVLSHEDDNLLNRIENNQLFPQASHGDTQPPVDTATCYVNDSAADNLASLLSSAPNDNHQSAQQALASSILSPTPSQIVPMPMGTDTRFEDKQEPANVPPIPTDSSSASFVAPGVPPTSSESIAPPAGLSLVSSTPNKTPAHFFGAAWASSSTGATASTGLGGAEAQKNAGPTAPSSAFFGLGKSDPGSALLTFEALAAKGTKDHSTLMFAPTASSSSTWGALLTSTSTSSPSPFGFMSKDDSEPVITGPTVLANKESHRERLVAFYTKHNPEKLSSVEATLEKYAGREDDLFAKLAQKYDASTFSLPTGTGPVTFLEFELSPSKEKHIVKIQLFADKTPHAAENFRCLCTGERGNNEHGSYRGPLCYRGNKIHRIKANMCVQGGDITVGDGTGGLSIYKPFSLNPKTDMWGNFADEEFLAHSEEGLVSMANNGKNHISSQFFVTLKRLSHLDGKHVVFGKVIEGIEIIRQIGSFETDANDRPVSTVTISDCGEIKVEDGKEIWIRASDKLLVSNPDSSSSTLASPSLGAGFTTLLSSSSAPSYSFGSSNTFGNTFGTTGLSFGSVAPPPNLASSSFSIPASSFAPSDSSQTSDQAILGSPGFSSPGVLGRTELASGAVTSRSAEYSFRSSNNDYDSSSSRDTTPSYEQGDDEDCAGEYNHCDDEDENSNLEDQAFFAQEAVLSKPQWGDAFQTENKDSLPAAARDTEYFSPQHLEVLPEEDIEEHAAETTVPQEREGPECVSSNDKGRLGSTLAQQMYAGPDPTNSISGHSTSQAPNNEETGSKESLPTSFCKPLSGWSLRAVSIPETITGRIGESSDAKSPRVANEFPSAAPVSACISAANARIHVDCRSTGDLKADPLSDHSPEGHTTKANLQQNTKRESASSSSRSSESSTDDIGPVFQVNSHETPVQSDDLHSTEYAKQSLLADRAPESPNSLARSSDSSTNVTGPVCLNDSQDLLGVGHLDTSKSSWHTGAARDSLRSLVQSSDSSATAAGPVLCTDLHPANLRAIATRESTSSSAEISDSAANAIAPVHHLCVSENPSSLGVPAPLGQAGSGLHEDALEEISSSPSRSLISSGSLPDYLHMNDDPPLQTAQPPRSSAGFVTAVANMRASVASSPPPQTSAEKFALRKVERGEPPIVQTKAHSEYTNSSPVEYVSIQSQGLDFDSEVMSNKNHEENLLHTPPRATANVDRHCSPGTTRLSDEGSVRSGDTFGSTVVEQIEVLQRDIEESSGRLQVTKQKVEEQQALLESRQLSVTTNTTSICYSRTLGGSEAPSAPSTPSPLRNCSLRQAQFTSIADAQSASQSVLHRLSHPEEVMFKKCEDEPTILRDLPSSNLSEQKHASDTGESSISPYSYDSVIASRMRSSPNSRTAPNQAHKTDRDKPAEAV